MQMLYRTLIHRRTFQRIATFREGVKFPWIPFSSQAVWIHTALSRDRLTKDRLNRQTYSITVSHISPTSVTKSSSSPSSSQTGRALNLFIDTLIAYLQKLLSLHHKTIEQIKCEKELAALYELPITVYHYIPFQKLLSLFESLTMLQMDSTQSPKLHTLISQILQHLVTRVDSSPPTRKEVLQFLTLSGMLKYPWIDLKNEEKEVIFRLVSNFHVSDHEKISFSFLADCFQSLHVLSIPWRDVPLEEKEKLLQRLSFLCETREMNMDEMIDIARLVDAIHELRITKEDQLMNQKVAHYHYLLLKLLEEWYSNEQQEKIYTESLTPIYSIIGELPNRNISKEQLTIPQRELLLHAISEEWHKLEVFQMCQSVIGLGKMGFKFEELSRWDQMVYLLQQRANDFIPSLAMLEDILKGMSLVGYNWQQTSTEFHHFVGYSFADAIAQACQQKEENEIADNTRLVHNIIQLLAGLNAHWNVLHLRQPNPQILIIDNYLPRCTRLQTVNILTSFAKMGIKWNRLSTRSQRVILSTLEGQCRASDGRWILPSLIALKEMELHWIELPLHLQSSICRRLTHTSALSSSLPSPQRIYSHIADVLLETNGAGWFYIPSIRNYISCLFCYLFNEKEHATKLAEVVPDILNQTFLTKKVQIQLFRLDVQYALANALEPHLASISDLSMFIDMIGRFAAIRPKMKTFPIHLRMLLEQTFNKLSSSSSAGMQDNYAQQVCKIVHSLERLDYSWYNLMPVTQANLVEHIVAAAQTFSLEELIDVMYSLAAMSLQSVEIQKDHFFVLHHSLLKRYVELRDQIAPSRLPNQKKIELSLYFEWLQGLPATRLIPLSFSIQQQPLTFHPIPLDSPLSIQEHASKLVTQLKQDWSKVSNQYHDLTFVADYQPTKIKLFSVEVAIEDQQTGRSKEIIAFALPNLDERNDPRIERFKEYLLRRYYPNIPIFRLPLSKESIEIHSQSCIVHLTAIMNRKRNVTNQLVK